MRDREAMILNRLACASGIVTGNGNRSCMGPTDASPRQMGARDHTHLPNPKGALTSIATQQQGA